MREIQRALVESAAMVSSPEYAQATAEVRAREDERDRRAREFML